MGINWESLLFFAYIFIIVSTTIIVLLENRNPLKALSWVIILVLLPIAGLIIYLIFGRDTRRYRLISKRSYERIMQNATPEVPIGIILEEPDLGTYQPISNTILDQTGNALLEADEVAFFTRGMDKFESLLADIRRAKEHIHIQYYIIKDDVTGNRLAEALCERANAGVEVRLLYDHVGSFNTKKRFFRKLQNAGVEVYPILEVVFPAWTSKVNYRNHRKVVVIDGIIGYIGGMNIADHYTLGNRLGHWRDTHARVTGSAVNGLQAAFMTDWYVATRRVLPGTLYHCGSKYSNGEEDNFSLEVSGIPSSKGVLMQTFTSGPTGQFRILLQILCRAIYNARESVRIQTPYFLPPESLYKAIISAGLAGIKVELMMPEKSDSFGVNDASHSYFDNLLKSGVHIYLYRSGFLHSKVATIDNEIAFIGSANMDFRSMEHNFEITSILYDEESTRILNQAIMNDMEECCERIDRKKWMKRPIKKRLWESLLRLFAPLM